MTDGLLLHTTNLSAGYKSPICTNINLSAKKGENICIIGKNGSGKSTFLRTISGILKSLSGNIYFNGKCIKHINSNQRARHLCFVPSRLSYFSNIKIIELILMGRAPYTNIFDKIRKEDMEIVEKAIVQFGLQELKNKHLYEVSDGERQKAMICKAFVQDTQLVLMDEPSAFLDYPSKVSLMNDLDDLCKNNNKTIIFSTHDLELGLKNADKLWICNDGEIISYDNKKSYHKEILKNVFNYSSL